MNRHSFPPPAEEERIAIGPLRELLLPALDAACDQAAKIFEHQFRDEPPFDPWLFAHIARHSTRKRLIVEGAGDLGYNLPRIANTGLFLGSEARNIRVLKATYRMDYTTEQLRRAVPNPGNSATRKEYFDQPQLNLGVSGPDVSGPSKIKLVILWDHDGSYQLNTLELACPKRWNPARNCVDLHWIVPIFSDADVSGAKPSPPPTADSIELEDLELKARRDESEAVSDSTG